jgi:hypothetical protein
VHERLGQHGGGGGAVTGDVVGLGRDFLHELGAHVLERVVELDFLRDRHTVVGDGRGAELLVEHHVAALGPERHLHGVGQLVDAGLERATSFVVELQHLRHGSAHFSTIARTSRLVRISRSWPSTVTSVPPYFEYSTVSPTCTVERGVGALVVAPAARADGDDRTLLGLLLRGVGDHQTRSSGLLGLVRLHDDAVVERLE